MSETKIKIDGDDITQALEDMRERYTAPAETQTEKSKRAVMEEIRAMIKAHPGMSNKEIALAVGSTPKQVTQQRYLMSEKGKQYTARILEKAKHKRVETPETAKAGDVPKYKEMHLPTLISVVKCVTFLGKVANYDVTNGMVEIKVNNNALDDAVPVADLGALIEELTALKQKLEGGTFVGGKA